jgi:hypothetical protein
LLQKNVKRFGRIVIRELIAFAAAPPPAPAPPTEKKTDDEHDQEGNVG